jgi:hypothetical protein
MPEGAEDRGQDGRCLPLDGAKEEILNEGVTRCRAAVAQLNNWSSASETGGSFLLIAS